MRRISRLLVSYRATKAGIRPLPVPHPPSKEQSPRSQRQLRQGLYLRLVEAARSVHRSTGLPRDTRATHRVGSRPHDPRVLCHPERQRATRQLYRQLRTGGPRSLPNATVTRAHLDRCGRFSSPSFAFDEGINCVVQRDWWQSQLERKLTEAGLSVTVGNFGRGILKSAKGHGT